MGVTHSVHATCVAWDGVAVLIKGQSGSGKSALGLQLMALGCDLVADDRVLLAADDEGLFASCPDTIAGLIEARGVGILNARAVSSAQVQLVVDLNEIEQSRMPERRVIELFGRNIPLIHRVSGDHFVPAILQILKAGWSNR
ncbi:HPr kinase/phosphorylase [Yoonia maritima]|uniref:HPr kinase/phosphorylase n=1 Tax=Yoonia maritima TaxID=1435347 RepID=A0A2T0VWL3_9RHOB|nr:HPr kinase/phosphatase C-terminal domain-containing protein [Yoonia maritima]PRY76216.1 HPr kinase/phosphorylase [Yoonia maritima]